MNIVNKLLNIIEATDFAVDDATTANSSSASNFCILGFSCLLKLFKSFLLNTFLPPKCINFPKSEIITLYIKNNERCILMNEINYINIKSICFLIVALILLTMTAFRSFFIPDELNTGNSNQTMQAENDDNDYSNYTPNETSSQESSKILTNSQQIYEVKALNGEITVFKDGEVFSVMLDTVKLDNLPDIDKDLINKGVTFQSYKELISFLENYE